MANTTLNLDVSKVPQGTPIIYGRIGDQDMQKITVNVTNIDQQIDLTGYTITFEGVTGGETKIFDVTGVSSNATDLKKGTFTYTFPNMAFAAGGRYKRAYFSLTKNKMRDTTGGFEMIVLDNADIDAKEAETIITEYNRLVEELNSAYEEALDQIGTDYDVIEQRIKGVETDIDRLRETIRDYQLEVEKISDDAKKEVSEATNHALDAVEEALHQLNQGDFYRKSESDDRFAQQEKTYTKEEVNALLTNVNTAPPIGTVVTNVLKAFDPTKAYPKTTWTRYAQGRVLVGVDESDPDVSEAGKTGGAKTVTLTLNEIPSHVHQQKFVTNRGTGNTSNTWSNDGNSDIRIHNGVFTEAAGGNQAHNNMPPYIAVYMWVRTA